MFISHLLATREVKANQCTQTNEGREVEDEEEVLRHGDTNSKRRRLKKTKLLRLCQSYIGSFLQHFTGLPKHTHDSPSHPHTKWKSRQQSFRLQSNYSYSLSQKDRFRFFFLETKQDLVVFFYLEKKNPKKENKFPDTSPRANSTVQPLYPPQQAIYNREEGAETPPLMTSQPNVQIRANMLTRLTV